MAEKQNDPCRIQLKDVRLSYPALWRPKGFGKKNEGEPAFQASFLIDPTTKIGKANLNLIDEAIETAKEMKWKDNPPSAKTLRDKVCLKDGDEDKEEEEGMMILSSRNPKKPLVIDRDKTELVEADGVVYAGCYVDAIVRIWAQDNDYGKRINCSLEAVRFRRDGDPFGAPSASADDFEDDEDDRPSRSRKSRDEDDEDEKPRSRKSRDEDEDEKPRARKSRDEDEDEKPRARKSRDEDEDEKPRSRKSRDEDDEEEKPRSRKSRDEDEDDRPSRRRSRDHDDI